MTSAAKSQPQNLGEAFGVSPTYDLTRRRPRPKQAEPTAEEPVEPATELSGDSSQGVAAAPTSNQRRPSTKATSGSRSSTNARKSTPAPPDEVESTTQSVRDGGVKPIVVYLTEEAHDRASRWREENRLTFGQMILIAVDRTAASGQLEAEFNTAFDTDGPTTGLFDFGPLPTKRSSDAKRNRTMSVTMTQSNLEALNKLAESLPGHPSRSFMISTALDLFLDSRR